MQTKLSGLWWWKMCLLHSPFGRLFHLLNVFWAEYVCYLHGKPALLSDWFDVPWSCQSLYLVLLSRHFERISWQPSGHTHAHTGEISSETDDDDGQSDVCVENANKEHSLLLSDSDYRLWSARITTCVWCMCTLYTVHTSCIRARNSPF